MREYEESGEEGLPPISKDFILWACDGDPVKTAAGIKAYDDEGRYKRIFLLAGIFHSGMEVFHKLNDREDDMLSCLVAPYYGKNDKQATQPTYLTSLIFRILLCLSIRLVLCLLG